MINTSFTYTLPEINEKIYFRAQKRQSLRFLLEQNENILCLYPSSFKEKEIINYLNKNLEKTKKYIARLHKTSIQVGKPIYIFGVPYNLAGINEFAITDNQVTLDSCEDDLLATVFYNLHKYFHKQVIEIFEEVYQNYFATEKKPQIIFKNIKSYWGQYNKKYHRITLSFRLFFYPKKVIKDVIIHEFCHIHHMNHGQDFHVLLSHFNVKDSEKMLKERKYG